MKERELRQHATCSVCKQPIGKSGVPLFWTVTVNRYGLHADAIRRQTGLGMMLGAPLAAVMGPDEDMATPVMEPVTLTMCEPCALGESLPIAAVVMP